MQWLVGGVRKRPVLAFFLICYAISWGFWLPVILSGNQLYELIAIIGQFGGPGFACIIVARVSRPAPPEDRSPPFWSAFLGSWIVCALILLVYQRSSSSGASVAATVIFALLALIPAYIIASAFSGPPAVRRTLSSLIHPPGGVGWYLLALILPVGTQLFSVWVSRQLGWGALNEPHPPADALTLAGSVLTVYLFTFLYAGGLNEETGWTGFALPRLMARFSPLSATVVLWALWMLWHVPLHLAGYFTLSPHVLIGSFFGRFLLTWLFLRSSGGMLTAMLLHASVNVTSQFLPVSNASLPVGAVIALLVVVTDKMWRRLPHDDPAVFTGQAAPT